MLATVVPVMNIVQITPGAGSMLCGGCFRDNALVAALRRAGHQALMVPLYLPLTLDEPDQSADVPIFYGGLNVYLEQKSVLFCRLPRWFRQMLASRRLLKWAGTRAAKTRAEDVGELTLSMFRGEEGRQAVELDQLITWLQTQPKPDLICLSNVMLIGMARRLRAELGAPVACLLGGEDSFLDGLPKSIRDASWAVLTARCRDVDLFLPPTHYFAALMSQRLQLRPDHVAVLPVGINLDGYPASRGSPQLEASDVAPVLGFFARMCQQKGLDTLIDAFILLKKSRAVAKLRLHVGGGCGPGDEPFVAEQRRKLESAGVLADVEFFPNVDHARKIEFLQGLTVFSTPALYGEAFGLYLIEALAAGVPIVQPRHAAFPEIIEATGGGILCEPGNAASLAGAIEFLVLDPTRAREMGERGRQAVREKFGIDQMAGKLVQLVKQRS
ncbi:MAG: glycosyltransferase family 1 protein [Pedosphaera sp.]|nr:glycosyltransferase family 1 protein [Pedosphaera sp.]